MIGERGFFMKKNELLQEAKKFEKELVTMRRWLHSHAETGFQLSETSQYVRDTLCRFGYEPQPCGDNGITFTIGKPSGKTILLRADMDALPIREESNISFACQNRNMHGCGHDMHTTMLLGAAYLLKERELSGQVKFMFQPAEELLAGSAHMIEHGILESPKVDAALMLHVMTDIPYPTGTVIIPPKGASAPAADMFTITIQGKGCHGSMPWKGTDVIAISSQIIQQIQVMQTREIPLSTPVVLTFGSIHAGAAANALSDTLIMKGSLRLFDDNTHQYVKKRLKEMIPAIAHIYDGEARIHFDQGCPTLQNHPDLVDFASHTLPDLLERDKIILSPQMTSDSAGSEDFSYVSHEVPSLMLALAAGKTEEGYHYPLHHPKVLFDEKALPVGSALYAYFACSFLENPDGKLPLVFS